MKFIVNMKGGYIATATYFRNYIPSSYALPTSFVDAPQQSHTQNYCILSSYTSISKQIITTQKILTKAITLRLFADVVPIEPKTPIRIYDTLMSLDPTNFV